MTGRRDFGKVAYEVVGLGAKTWMGKKSESNDVEEQPCS